jgi:hypothetical protein
MTTRARQVLADCEHALADFSASANTAFQRTRWVAVVTLLRTVGLVLKEVDRPVASDTVQRRIDDAWKRLKTTKPEPRIFHDFIDAERADVVHFYDISARVDATVQLGGVWASMSGGEGGSDPHGPTIYDFIMRDGPYQGRDPRELCREAIEFWRGYLDDIERRST